MPAAPRPPFVDHCLELLAPLGALRARRMFGGWGIDAGGLFLAIIASDQLYLKADEAGKTAFAAAGAQPFVYDAKGKQMTMGYWTAPDDALDSAPAMLPWARLALRAAVAAQAAKVAKVSRSAKPAKPATAVKPPSRAARTAARLPAAPAAPAATTTAPTKKPRPPRAG